MMFPFRSHWKGDFPIATIEYYVAVSFVRDDESEMVYGQAMAAQSSAEAKFLAQRLARQDGGAVAFKRKADPDIGHYEDAEILGTYGEIPDDIEEQVKRGIDTSMAM